MTLLTEIEFRKRLQAGERFIADGAMGTELMKRGVPMNGILAANQEHHEWVCEIHEAYLQAGARIITANTFGVYSGEESLAVFVAGIANVIVGVSGAKCDIGYWFSLMPKTLLEPVQNLPFLIMGRSVSVLIETCVSMEEVLAALRVVNEHRPRMVAVTCYFRADGTMPDGTLPEEAFWTLRRERVNIIGANCGDTPESLVEVAKRMRNARPGGRFEPTSETNTLLLFQPSAGLPTQNERGEWVYPVGPEEWAEVGMQLFAAGVNIVGGCCGTTPAHIAALAGRMAEE